MVHNFADVGSRYPSARRYIMRKISKKFLDLISEVQTKHPKWSKDEKFIYILSKNGRLNGAEINAIMQKFGDDPKGHAA
jgi:hypothetical protein